MIISSRRQSQCWSREKLMCSAIILTGLAAHANIFAKIITPHVIICLKVFLQRRGQALKFYQIFLNFSPIWIIVIFHFEYPEVWKFAPKHWESPHFQVVKFSILLGIFYIYINCTLKRFLKALQILKTYIAWPEPRSPDLDQGWWLGAPDSGQHGLRRLKHYQISPQTLSLMFETISSFNCLIGPLSHSLTFKMCCKKIRDAKAVCGDCSSIFGKIISGGYGILRPSLSFDLERKWPAWSGIHW